MDLTTYTGVQSAIAETINRPDMYENGATAGWITLAEATMRRELRRAVTKATFTFDPDTDSKALAATVAEIRSIAPAKTVARPRGGKPLIGLSWETFLQKREQLEASGRPQFYTVFDNTVYVCPAPTTDWLDFDITTYDALVPVSTSTALLLEAPDLYLYGGLMHSAPYLEHDERFPLWEKLFGEAIVSLNEKRQKEEFGMSLMAARLPVNFG